MASYATAPELGRYAIRSVDRAEVLRYLGYLGHEVAPGFDEELDARIDRVIARCVDVSQPAGMVRVFDIAAAGTADEPPRAHERDAGACQRARAAAPVAHEPA